MALFHKRWNKSARLYLGEILGEMNSCFDGSRVGVRKYRDLYESVHSIGQLHGDVILLQLLHPSVCCFLVQIRAIVSLILRKIVKFK